MAKPQTRTEQLAEAVYKVAKANHYMVGIVEPVTQDEIDGARELLIDKQNALHPANARYAVCDLALDILDRPVMHGVPIKAEGEVRRG